MDWDEVRQHYPHQWLLVEAIRAHSKAGKRIVEQLAVVKTFTDAQAAMGDYAQLHREAPERELYVLHTDRDNLDIAERKWLGIRRPVGATRRVVLTSQHLRECVSRLASAI